MFLLPVKTRVTSVCRKSSRGAFTDLPGVFHEEAVDQHSARKRLHGRLDLSLLPGELQFLYR